MQCVTFGRRGRPAPPPVRRTPVSNPPPPSRRRFLSNALGATVGAGLGVAVLSSCQDTGTPSAAGATGPSTQPPAVEPPVTTGDQALRRLLEGNARFVANRTEAIDEGLDRRVAVSK